MFLPGCDAILDSSIWGHARYVYVSNLCLLYLWFTAYDWMKSARKQNNFQKDLGEFARSEEMTRKFVFEPKFARKRPFNGKNFNDLDFN